MISLDIMDTIQDLAATGPRDSVVAHEPEHLVNFGPGSMSGSDATQTDQALDSPWAGLKLGLPFGGRKPYPLSGYVLSSFK
jgi:hypothetical protein